VPATLDGYQGLVIMGGPQSVYEEDRFPYLKAEKALTRHAVETNRPVLGVCLGSQILAEVLGSSVRGSGSLELGWKKVTLSPQGQKDSLLKHLPHELTPLHWHGDIYDLPPGAELLAASEMTAVQAFAWKKRCYGFLFHLEATLKQILAMTQLFPEDVLRGGTTPEALAAESQRYLEAIHEPVLKLFREWATLV
jgi:GMP synthase (glutamine-hydrolysing)